MSFDSSRHQALNDALARGQERLVEWTEDGTLVPRAEFAQACQATTDSIEAAVQRGDLFEIWVGDAPYLPSELIALGLDYSFAICSQLGEESPASKLIFLLRKHGGLGGKTVAEALRTGTSLERILQLAQLCGDA